MPNPNPNQNLSRGRGVVKTKGNREAEGSGWYDLAIYLCDQIRLNFLIVKTQKAFIYLG